MMGSAAWSRVPAQRRLRKDAHASALEQTELLNMWDRPFHTVTTTMLWNAASDDAGSYHDGGNDDTEYDTYGNNGCGENPVPRGACFRVCLRVHVRAYTTYTCPCPVVHVVCRRLVGSVSKSACMCMRMRVRVRACVCACACVCV